MVSPFLSKTNSIDSQNDCSEALQSAVSHFSTTIPDPVGAADNHEKSTENADPSKNAADGAVNNNTVGQIQQYPGR